MARADGADPGGAGLTLSAPILLRKSLEGRPCPPTWPVGTRLTQFDPSLLGRDVHELLVEAYKTGGGSVGEYEQWLTSLAQDREYDPALVFSVLGPDGRLVAVAQCWTCAFIKDLAVKEGWRRQGLGEALLLHVFQTFQERGAPCVDLKVEPGNRHGAERLYRRVGMLPVQAPA
jgi:ribosomal protein S18 acetylase RimI-like enzyme